MTLLEVNTESKSLEITKLIKNIPNKSNGGYLWLGGIRTQIENDDFVWLSTGERFNYTNWYPNNPDFTGDDEYCVELVEIRNWQWNDLYCKRKRGFACEYKPATGDIQQELQNLKETLKQQDSKREKQLKLMDLLNQIKDNEPQKLLKISQLQNNIKEILQKDDENNNLKMYKDNENFEKSGLQNNGKNNIHVYSPYSMFFNNF
ncbi:lectin subunit alpha-like [Lucilia cuprina]|uniref:lectin subunit alpha-like n=1 Tax=Lucilia cuprina TaxID=7375 RepID=UPI001F05F956|nr:lectin subunit alpha-like [Lucilia cuprina]